MDLPRNAFKHAIAAGTPQIGAWLMSAAPSTAEALGCVGFDFLVVDMEHTPIDTPQMIDILRAIAGTSASAVTRLPWNDTVMVKRALDAGAQSLMFPFVQDEHEAARAVASTRYPPAGIRGAAGTHRGSRYGTVPGYFKVAASEICVTVQIETLQALERLPMIAAVPGVDGIFVGPGDLSVSIDAIGAKGADKLNAAIGTIIRATIAHNKAAGIFCASPQSISRWAAAGASFFMLASDTMFLGAGAAANLAAARNELA